MARKNKELSAFEKLRKFELAHPDHVRIFDAWFGLNSTEKGYCRRAWDEYYVRCSNGVAQHLNRLMQKAIRSGDMNLIRRIKVQNTRLLEERSFVPRPTVINPYELAYGNLYQTYRMLIRNAQKENGKNPESVTI